MKKISSRIFYALALLCLPFLLPPLLESFKPMNTPYAMTSSDLYCGAFPNRTSAACTLTRPTTKGMRKEQISELQAANEALPTNSIFTENERLVNEMYLSSVAN